MNIGRTALLTAAAGAAVLSGASGASANVPFGGGSTQSNECATSSGVNAPKAETDCLNFARVFGGSGPVVQENECSSSSGLATSIANVILFQVPEETSTECANVAIVDRSEIH